MLNRRTFIGKSARSVAGLSLLACRAYGQRSERVVTVDPYRGIDWSKVRRLRANLHTHTTVSDGRLPPYEAVDEYHRRGYQVLALTDHNKVNYPWTAFDRWKPDNQNRDPNALKMLSLEGNELSRHHHTLSLFTDFNTESRDWEEVLTALGRYRPEARGVVCHPAMHWTRRSGSNAPEISVPLTPPLRKISRGDFTLEAWFRTTDPARNILLGNYTGSAPGAVNLELHTDNRVRLYIQPPKGQTTDLNLAAGTVNTRDGRWHHLAGVRRDGEALLYLDGRRVGRARDGTGAFDLVGAAFFLGRDARSGNTVLNGDLGLVRLWTAGVTDQDVAVLAKPEAIERLPEGFAGGRVLAEYRFAQGRGAPLKAGGFSGVIDDTAGHGEGPFPATARSVVLATEGDGAVSRCMARFPAGRDRPLPKAVPDEVIADYADLFLRHGHMRAIEVVNGSRPITEYPLDRALWDGILSRLMPRRPVWGLAVDDMHAMVHLGREWAVFLTSEMSEAAIRQALDNGVYTFASRRVGTADPAVGDPPLVERITHDTTAGRMTLAATADGPPLPDSAYVWISMGTRVHVGPVLNYREIAGIGHYVRAEITAAGGTTFLNPYGFAG
ncbi:MAG TPA: hypothetical protein P5026_11755 [Kiritimatiellia bacterium]|nr:hypothetical protein [Kiritimatiellia bacterium]